MAKYAYKHMVHTDLYKPDLEHACCEACVFGRGLHAPWCKVAGEVESAAARAIHENRDYQRLQELVNEGAQALMPADPLPLLIPTKEEIDGYAE